MTSWDDVDATIATVELVRQRVLALEDQVRELTEFIAAHIHPLDVAESIAWEDGKVVITWIGEDVYVKTSGNHPDVVSARQAALNEYHWEMGRKHDR